MKTFFLKMRIFLFIFIILAALRQDGYCQISFSRNHPELIWRTFDTEHFQIIYHQGIETLAQEVAKIAEQVYTPITTDLGVEPPSKTPIIVTDYLDYSNGLATPLGHYIIIWSESYTKYMTGRLTWLQAVVAHEFTHIVNFYAFRAFPGFWRELFALGFVPTWFLEGLAEYEAEQWCTHRDMLLRVVAYHRKLLPYKKMAGFIGADQIDARLVYEQGHSLIRYIASRYGHDKIALIIKKFRAFPVSFNLALKRSLGISRKQLFKEWKQEVQLYYTEAYKNHRALTKSEEVLRTPFQGNYGARWQPAGDQIAIVAAKEYDEQIPELYLYNPPSGKMNKVAGPYINSFFSWSPDGKYIVYSQKHVVANGSLFNDLFMLNSDNHEIKRLTTSERATDPHWHPDGRSIVYVVHQGARSNLAVLDLASGEKNLVTDFPSWTEVFTPQWSPDGKKIVFSIFDNRGQRDICCINKDGTGFVRLTNHPDDDRYPTWSPDGKKIAFISYRSGIPNLYIKNLTTGAIQQLTDTPGGVFNPTWLPDGQHLSVIAFEDREETDIIILAIPQDQQSPATGKELTGLKFHRERQPVTFTHPASIMDFNSSAKPFHALSHLRSQLLFPYLDKDEKGWQPGILNLFADPLGKHTLLTTLSYRTRPHFLINYTNRQFGPTIQLIANKTTIDHGDFLNVNETTTLPLYENYWSGSLTFYWQLNFGKSLLSNHLFWLRQTVTYRNSINSNDYEEQHLAQWAQPFQGWVNYLTIGYSWISDRPNVGYNIHPKYGNALGIQVRHGDHWLGSDITFSQLNLFTIIRREIPFAEHVIALRGGAVFRSGDQAIQDRPALSNYYIRGLSYSLEGDRQLFANLEYRFPLIRDLGLKISIVYFERFCGALFIDSGKAWGSDIKTFYQGSRRNFNEVSWVHTAGVELRHRLYLLGKIPVVISGGYGINLADKSEADYYFRIGPVF